MAEATWHGFGYLVSSALMSWVSPYLIARVSCQFFREFNSTNSIHHYYRRRQVLAEGWLRQLWDARPICAAPKTASLVSSLPVASDSHIPTSRLSVAPARAAGCS